MLQALSDPGLSYANSYYLRNDNMRRVCIVCWGVSFEIVPSQNWFLLG